jgi:hydroxymethylpyrimidine/phosphomethylpyrimidine kinase
VPLVVDPVLRSTSGTPLLDAAAIGVLTERLIARAAVLTPNLPEAEALLGRTIDAEAMEAAARSLRALGAATVVLKGGHLEGERVRDVVVEGDQCYRLESPRQKTRHTHGTGCTLASAIATGLAQGLTTRAAIERAHAYVQKAIESAPGLGQGRGPLNHAHTVRDEL